MVSLCCRDTLSTVIRPSLSRLGRLNIGDVGSLGQCGNMVDDSEGTVDCGDSKATDSADINFPPGVGRRGGGGVEANLKFADFSGGKWGSSR
jgi:hypothetical protein